MANPNVHDGAPKAGDGQRVFTAIGGNDGTNNYGLKVNSDGSIDVNSTAADVVTANQGTQGSTASPWFVEPVGTSSTGPLLPNAATAGAGGTLPVATSVYNVQLIERGGNTITDIAVAGSLTGAAASIGVQAVSPHTWSATNTFDPLRGNLAVTLAASAARTSTLTVSDQTNYNGAMVHVIVDVTAYTSGGLTPVINGKDPASSKYYALVTGLKIVAIGTTVLKVGPSFATIANASASDMVPRTWNVVATPDDATSITYSVGANVNE